MLFFRILLFVQGSSFILHIYCSFGPLWWAVLLPKFVQHMQYKCIYPTFSVRNSSPSPKHEFLKSVGFSHYFCEVKLVIFGPFSDRIRLRPLFGRSGLSPDSLFCRTWGPILAHACFWSNVHLFFTFSSFSLFATAVKIVALVWAKRTSVIKSRSSA